MKAKKIVTGLLLLFVAITVGTIVVKETSEQASEMAPVLGTTNRTVGAPVKVVVYYFHGNYRCPTCLKIEALTAEAANTGFAGDIRNGRVELKSVNVEEQGNEHYIQDYELASRSVVVARYEGESPKAWKRLDAVWTLHGDRDGFFRLVQDETRLLLGDAHT
jgi:hypothetical protein